MNRYFRWHKRLQCNLPFNPKQYVVSCAALVVAQVMIQGQVSDIACFYSLIASSGQRTCIQPSGALLS